MERSEFSTHISENLNRNLEALFNKVLEMGGLVERQLELVVPAMQNADIAKAKEVLQVDKIINRNEVDVDHLCANLLARQQPTASDLRLIIMAIRIAMDLERMGDEVAKVAKIVTRMADVNKRCADMPGFDELIQLNLGAHEMLKKVLNAFARLELSDVQSVFSDESKMDKVFKKAIKTVNDSFDSTDVAPEYLMEMVNALRSAERVTDHAENIAQSIIYLVEGQDVRNMDSDKLKDFLAQL